MHAARLFTPCDAYNSASAVLFVELSASKTVGAAAAAAAAVADPARSTAQPLSTFQCDVCQNSAVLYVSADIHLDVQTTRQCWARASLLQ
jgi:hypothetical protein